MEPADRNGRDVLHCVVEAALVNALHFVRGCQVSCVDIRIHDDEADLTNGRILTFIFLGTSENNA